MSGTPSALDEESAPQLEEKPVRPIVSTVRTQDGTDELLEIVLSLSGTEVPASPRSRRPINAPSYELAQRNDCCPPLLQDCDEEDHSEMNILEEKPIISSIVKSGEKSKKSNFENNSSNNNSRSNSSCSSNYNKRERSSRPSSPPPPPPPSLSLIHQALDEQQQLLVPASVSHERSTTTVDNSNIIIKNKEYGSNKSLINNILIEDNKNTENMSSVAAKRLAMSSSETNNSYPNLSNFQVEKNIKTEKKKSGFGGFLQRFTKLRFSGRSKVPRSEIIVKNNKKLSDKQSGTSGNFIQRSATFGAGDNRVLDKKQFQQQVVKKNSEPDYIIIPLHPTENEKNEEENKKICEIERSKSSLSSNGHSTTPVHITTTQQPKSLPIIQNNNQNNSNIYYYQQQQNPEDNFNSYQITNRGGILINNKNNNTTISGESNKPRRRAVTDLGNPVAIEMAKARAMLAGQDHHHQYQQQHNNKELNNSNSSNYHNNQQHHSISHINTSSRSPRTYRRPVGLLETDLDEYLDDFDDQLSPKSATAKARSLIDLNQRQRQQHQNEHQENEDENEKYLVGTKRLVIGGGNNSKRGGGTSSSSSGSGSYTKTCSISVKKGPPRNRRRCYVVGGNNDNSKLNYDNELEDEEEEADEEEEEDYRYYNSGEYEAILKEEDVDTGNNVLRVLQSVRGSAASEAAVRQRPHKSMEFLLDKENLHFVKPPENELQKVGERVPSEHELRVQRSLQKLNVPDWYKNSPASKDGGGFRLKRHSDASQHGGWRSLGSKTTSLSSLSSSSNRQPTTGTLLSPSPTPPVFSRWSTSLLNSAGSSPANSARSSFNHRQPYLGWRSQERLTNPRTPAERLAQGILPQLKSVNKVQPANHQESHLHHPQQNQQQHQQHQQPQQQQQLQQPNHQTTNQQLEVRNSIKEVTSAIVHYVQSGQESAGTGGLSPQTRPDGWGEDRAGSRSTSPRGSNKVIWMESSFVGVRPVDPPEVPIVSVTKSNIISPSSPLHQTTTPQHQHQNQSQQQQRQVQQQQQRTSNNVVTSNNSNNNNDSESVSVTTRTTVMTMTKTRTNELSKEFKECLSCGAVVADRCVCKGKSNQKLYLDLGLDQENDNNKHSSNNNGRDHYQHQTNYNHTEKEQQTLHQQPHHQRHSHRPHPHQSHHQQHHHRQHQQEHYHRGQQEGAQETEENLHQRYQRQESPSPTIMNLEENHQQPHQQHQHRQRHRSEEDPHRHQQHHHGSPCR